MSTDFKTSLLVNRQLPEFVRDEYPLFQTFLEAYYEFLENEQGTQNNDVIKKSKDLRFVSDVDFSIDEFESSFFNSFASLLPREVEVTKEFLIKNVLPLYLSKGSEKSFKLLFRLLFNDEVQITFPKENVLRASDGKWTVDNILKIETDIRSLYTANGTSNTFVIAQNVTSDEIDVFVNDVIQTEGVDYFLRKETKKIIFISPPTANSEVKVVYNNFDASLLNNRKITGVTSGATAIVERAVPRIITDQLNFGLPFELFIDARTLLGDFVNGERINTDIFVEKEKLLLEADTFSILTRINIIDGGSGYNVADPVTIVGGGASISSTAEVSEVSTGFTSRIVVNYGGAGFKLASLISSSNTPGDTLITGAVDAVNSSHFTANTYLITDDIIDNYATINISDPDYGFPSPITENANTRIVDALSPLEVTGLGPITNAVILFSNTSVNTSILDSEGAIYQAGNNFFDIKTFRSIGRIDIIDAGLNYNVGDEIVFSVNPPGTYGLGAAAAVKNVNVSTGAIQTIEIQPPRIDGTANVINNTVEIVGTGTLFDTQLQVGDKIIIRSQERFVNAITSATTANVNVAFSFTDGTVFANNCAVGSFAKGIVGGISYTQNNFPTVTVDSLNGTGANVIVKALMGDGEDLKAFSDAIAGQILSISLTSGGEGYQYIPQVDLSTLGDGNATANAALGPSYSSFPGRWITSDSIISNSERKLQGANYYIDFSYVTASLTEFARYKRILFDLLHPAGFVNYADLNKNIFVEVPQSVTQIDTSNTISGLVSITNTSIFVTGIGTRFNVANSLGILTIGTNIVVNNEIKVVDSIISNTNLSVTSAFTSTANNKELIIVA